MDLVDRKYLNSLKKSDNFLAILYTFLRFFFHTVMVILALFFLNSPFPIVSIFFLIPHFLFFSFFGVAGFSHELFHGNVFKNKVINELLYKFSMIITWNNYEFFRLTHWRHHINTLTESDPKELFKGSLRPLNLFWMLTFDFPKFYRRVTILFRNAFGFFPPGVEEKVFINNLNNKKKVIDAARVILIFHVSVASVLIVTGLWEMVIIFNLAAFFLNFYNNILAISQHYGLEGFSKNDFVQNTRTVILGPITSFFYSDMNYHIEHHLYPAVPFYNLHRLHESIRNSVEDKNVVNGSLALFIVLRNYGLFRIKQDKNW